MRRALVVLALSLASCAPELGVCVPDEARRVVYDEASGTPAFEGQALMIRSCGSGGFCHSEGIAPSARNGAPAGLDYDLRPASSTDSVELEATARLRRNLDHALRDRESIWAEVAGLRMPIPGPATDQVAQAAPFYEHVDLRSGERTPGPSIDDEGGREILRNWLACGLPVVERTQPPALGEPRVDHFGVIVTSQEQPLEPRWADIYERMIATRCASAPCHGASAEGELDLREPAAALSALLAGSAAGEHCEDTGTPWLVPEDADGSLFYQKLVGVDATGEPVCGEPMPQSGARVSTASLEAVRAWIANGANP